MFAIVKHHPRGSDRRQPDNLSLFHPFLPRLGRYPRRTTSFCVLDNDFARAQFGRAPMDTLRVTAAHEFFHAIQFNYDYREDRWLIPYDTNGVSP